MKRWIGVVALALFQAALVPNSASADGEAPPPSYASTQDHVEGSIAHVEGKFTLTVHDDRGFIDHVRMHQGTVIVPVGLTLSEGMHVRIYGRPGGSEFLADEIDTPYQTYGGYVPYPAVIYPYAGDGYPYYGSFGYRYYGPGRPYWR